MSVSIGRISLLHSRSCITDALCRTGIGKQELDAAISAEQRHWESLDTKGKISEWANRNKWGVILGSWGASMVGSFGIIMRNRYQTFPQKV